MTGWTCPVRRRHITRTLPGAPPVALDPNPADNFVYKGLRYAENDAAVDTDKKFTATTPGHAVLLFSEIQRDGRGQAREFLRSLSGLSRRRIGYRCSVPGPPSLVAGFRIGGRTLPVLGRVMSDDPKNVAS